MLCILPVYSRSLREINGYMSAINRKLHRPFWHKFVHSTVTRSECTLQTKYIGHNLRPILEMCFFHSNPS
jgi:hypothetical protein